MLDGELNALARRQGGLFTRRQALEVGYTHFMIQQRIEKKLWRRVLGGVLTAGSTSLSPPAMEWAAYLACGEGAVLSGPSALRKHEMFAYAGPTWVTIPPERHVDFRGVRTIRESLPPEDITEVSRMLVTTPERSVVDTLRVLPPPLVTALLDRALLRGWLTVDDLVGRVIALTGRRGIGALRKHLGRVRGGARSEAERRLHVILDEGGVTGWEPNAKVLDSGGEVQAVLDAAFRAAMVAIEVDGLAFHTDPGRFQRDRARQNWLVNHGWLVLRFTWDDLTLRRGHVLATIKAALASRQDPTHR